MQHLHLVQQQIANVREDMTKLWKLREEGKTWDSTQKDSYSKLESKMKELARERDQRIEFERHLVNEKPKAVKKFERETDLNIVNLLRSVLYKKYNRSEYKEDLGQIAEYTRESEIETGQKPAGDGIAIPSRTFKYTRDIDNPQHTRTTYLSTSNLNTDIVPKVDPGLLYQWYSQSIFSKLNIEQINVPAGNLEFRKILVKDPVAQSASSKAEGASLDEKDLELETAWTAKGDRVLDVG